MTGSTHLKVGVLSYILVVFLQVGVVTPLISVGTNISLVGVIVAAIAALAPDVDSKRSKFNKANILIESQLRLLKWFEVKLLLVMRVALALSVGYLLYNNAEFICIEIYKLNVSWIQNIKSVHVKIVAGLIALLGSLNSGLLRSIPLINVAYKGIEKIIENMFKFLKRVAFFIVYAGAGVGLAVYNFKTYNSIYIYLFSVLLVCVVLFSHRTFFHSLIEGGLLTSILALKCFQTLGYDYLGWCYIVGYSSHLVLTDMLTKEGIYVTVVHKVLDKLFVGKILYNKSDKYKRLYKFLDTKKLRLPLMSTGSDFGNFFEATYVMVLLGIVIYYYFTTTMYFTII